MLKGNVAQFHRDVPWRGLPLLRHHTGHRKAVSREVGREEEGRLHGKLVLICPLKYGTILKRENNSHYKGVTPRKPWELKLH